MEWKHLFSEKGYLMYIPRVDYTEMLSEILKTNEDINSLIVKILNYSDMLRHYYWSSILTDQNIDFNLINNNEELSKELKDLIIKIFKDYIDLNFNPNEFLLVMYKCIKLAL
ncbi:MAG: hypothetical protein KatS3mg002_0409 [Candidatus Woesearchaeota archaeon]|nr:MAG: hypothetical protein KatS3mg002_0409 [Candidatus Woesearchaeota archaeon]